MNLKKNNSSLQFKKHPSSTHVYRICFAWYKADGNFGL